LKRRFGFAAILAVGVLLGFCSSANAYFERLFVSARARALGGTGVAVVDDAGATALNAAGLAQISKASFLSSLARPYQLSDLQENFLAAAVHTRLGTMGLSWHRFGLQDVTTEDLFTIAFAHDIIRDSQDASLSVGGSLDVARVGYSTGAYGDTKTVFTGSLGVLLRPFPMIGLGYSARNLGQPAFDWVPGDGATRLGATHAFGLAYYWEENVLFTYERARGQADVWVDAFGIEVNAGDQVRMRGGLNSGGVTGGLGVRVSALTIDAGVSTHDVMGLTYYMSVSVTLRDSEEGYPYE
jgi:hypothetical protein